MAAFFSVAVNGFLVLPQRVCEGEAERGTPNQVYIEQRCPRWMQRAREQITLDAIWCSSN